MVVVSSRSGVVADDGQYQLAASVTEIVPLGDGGCRYGGHP